VTAESAVSRNANRNGVFRGAGGAQAVVGGNMTGQIFAALEAELSGFVEARSPEFLRTALAGGCYVYGAGGYGRRILALLKAQGFTCHGVLDRKFTTSGEVDGVPALHPQVLMAADVAGKALLIGVHNPAVDLAPIIAFGREVGFGEVLWNADLPDALGSGADNYWLTARAFTLAHFADITAAANLLADAESIETLAALIRYRITGDAAAYPPADISQQYMPDGLLNFPTPICFVDGGAYNGDTLAYLHSRNVAVKTWLAFEPDPENFKALCGFAATVSARAALFPCGLSDAFVQVQFTANEGTASHLGDGGMTIPCVALDDVLHGESPDYIKLDIEGAEAAAQHGMRRTIAASRPTLAVSAYHRPADLWALVPLVAALAPYAKLHLRQHALNAFDTVLYAVRALTQRLLSSNAQRRLHGDCKA